MKRITIIGGGAWGVTLGQVLVDNYHQVLIYDINVDYIQKINNQRHPIFSQIHLGNIVATSNLEEAIDYSNILILALPTQKIRFFLKKLNPLLTQSKNFINVSKGIEQQTQQLISQILYSEIDSTKIKNYACLMGPSHAEEVIHRKITFLLASSLNSLFAREVANLFSNGQYVKVFCSDDVVGCEVSAAFKNSLAFISGLLVGNESFGKNAQAALLTLGLKEQKIMLDLFHAKPETFYSLASLGDLIVTSFNPYSRNFQAGLKFSSGQDLVEIYQNSLQTIEGIYNLQVFYNLACQNNLFLPLIHYTYQVIFEKKPINYILKNILSIL
ncbi:MAG: NAD(P)-binding domain-containing protein [Vigna little leaf phytoplasma]|nr:NAD(P)-binding domain-containing protein [Vigna little leaf phytoplasma]